MDSPLVWQPACPGETNRTYGTAKVLLCLMPDYADLPGCDVPQMRSRASGWLLDGQNKDGGWGGDLNTEPSSLEETALAVDALSILLFDTSPEDPDRLRTAVRNGVEFLIRKTNRGTEFEVAPIGFYFAKLWYHERLYPVVWTVSALANASRALSADKGE